MKTIHAVILSGMVSSLFWGCGGFDDVQDSTQNFTGKAIATVAKDASDLLKRVQEQVEADKKALLNSSAQKID